MSRLPAVRRDQLSPEGQAVWDSLVASRGQRIVSAEGTLSGPFNAFVRAPKAGGHAADLGAAVRFGSSFGQRLTEVAIITVASRWHAEFEWWAHTAIAREEGVADAVIDAIGKGEQPPFDKDDERVIYTAAHEIVTDGQLSQASYDAARDQVGEQGVAELVLLCGYYSLISFTLNTFAIPLPEGVEPHWAGAPAA